jgi:branched-chain amino acid aminotransferase
VGSGEAGATTQKLRQALNDIQWGKAEDKFGWLQKV